MVNKNQVEAVHVTFSIKTVTFKNGRTNLESNHSKVADSDTV